MQIETGGKWMKNRKYDFAGWVTKNDILCDDGRTIKHGAFVESPTSVPLVWNHDTTIPENIIGTVELEHSAEGTYGYGYFNGTDTANHAKQMVKHGDISAMSIRANNLIEKVKDVVGGKITEVSLVLQGANPGALIDTVMSHSGETADHHIIYTGELIHSADSLPKQEEEKEVDLENKETTEEKTVQDVLDTMDDDQLKVTEILIGLAVEETLKDEDETEEETEEETEDEGDGTDMKHNSFEGNGQVVGAAAVVDPNENPKGMTANELLHSAGQSGLPSLKHAANTYGISNIEVLFPDFKNTQGVKILEDKNTNATAIMGMVSKSPFAHVKTIIADLNEDYMRAKGYITANRKKEDVFALLSRKIGPTTVYKKQKLDRDDIIDITDINVVQLVQGTMRPALIKELVRAMFFGDGREVLVNGEANPDKIKEDCIIPITKDDNLYCSKHEVDKVEDVLEAVMYLLTEYQGDGTPTLFCNPTLATSLKLAKTTTGKYLFGDVPTLESMASRMGVAAIVTSSIFPKNDIVITNLSDYQFGSSKGGEITDFEDFDIDYNQYKFLIETRLSGGLTTPKSAFYLKVKEVMVGKPSTLVQLTDDSLIPSTPPTP